MQLASAQEASEVLIMTRLLALDQASRVSGWSVFIDGELKDWGHLTTEQEDVGKRLVAIRTFILQKVEEWDIDTIAFEDIQLQANKGNNVHTFKVLANVYGTVLETAVEYNKTYLIVPSVTWKSYLNIKGRSRPEQKRNAKTYVESNLKVKVTQDEADSICIGLYACGKGLEAQEGHDWSE